MEPDLGNDEGEVDRCIGTAEKSPGVSRKTKLQDKGCDVGRMEVSESGLWHSGNSLSGFE